MESAKDRRSHRLENIPYRRENRLDDTPRSNKEVLDLLKCVLNGLPRLVSVDARLFKHRTQQRVIALHEVHEVLDQKRQYDDGRCNGDRLELDRSQTGLYLCKQTTRVFQEADDLAGLARHEKSSNRDGNELEQLVTATQLVAQPLHGVTDTVCSTERNVGYLRYCPRHRVRDTKCGVHLAEPQSPLASYHRQGVRDFVLNAAKLLLDGVGIVNERRLQVCNRHRSGGRHFLQFVRGGAELLVEQFHRFWRTFQELAHGFTVNIAFCKGLVDRFHQASDFFVRLTGGFEQHCRCIVELNGLVDIPKQFRAFMHEVGDNACGCGIAAARLAGGLHDFLLDLCLISESGGRVLNLLVYSSELFNQRVYSRKAEADADSTEHFRGSLLDIADRIVDLLDIAFIDLEADLVEELSYRHSHHLAFDYLSRVSRRISSALPRSMS